MPQGGGGDHAGIVPLGEDLLQRDVHFLPLPAERGVDDGVQRDSRGVRHHGVDVLQGYGPGPLRIKGEFLDLAKAQRPVGTEISHHGLARVPGDAEVGFAQGLLEEGGKVTRVVSIAR